MAITGPSELPHVLKVDSDPMKKYVLSKLGHPVVEVEVTEDQWETVLKVTGNFIAHYFSKEQMFAVFYTNPLQSDYDLPNNAYWIQEVAWDPVTTKIDQIFGAESFLFCFAPYFRILRNDNNLIAVENWKDEYKCVTPYGDKKISIKRHDHKQPIVEIRYEGGSLCCTPNHPIKLNDDISLENWQIASEVEVGDKLVSTRGISEVIAINNFDVSYTHSIVVPSSHCFYGCHYGHYPVLVH